MRNVGFRKIFPNLRNVGFIFTHIVLPNLRNVGLLKKAMAKFAYIVEICEIFAITQNLHEKCEFRSVKLAISSLSSNFREPIQTNACYRLNNFPNSFATELLAHRLSCYIKASAFYDASFANQKTNETMHEFLQQENHSDAFLVFPCFFWLSDEICLFFGFPVKSDFSV